MSDAQLIAGFFYLILGILAVAFLLVSVLVNRSEKRKARDCTVPVTAEIIEIQKRWMDLDADGPRTYSCFPKYRFRWNDKDMEIVDNTGHKEGYQKVGERRTLYVNPDKPEDFYAEGDRLTQILVIVFRLVGIVLLMALVAVFVIGRKITTG
ncbi:MAG: DUF3592 domain-containing protein [Lachnospiraceae bacterium]|nr:DUF3592 domain-containing protein [Lachnospiraceae bacterium]